MNDQRLFQNRPWVTTWQKSMGIAEGGLKFSLGASLQYSLQQTQLSNFSNLAGIASSKLVDLSHECYLQFTYNTPLLHIQVLS